MHKNLDIAMRCIESVYFTAEEGIEVAFEEGKEYDVFFDDEGNDYLIYKGFKCQYSYYEGMFRKHFQIVFLDEKED